MSKLGLVENILISSSGIFGLVFAGGPVVFLYRNEIIELWDSNLGLEDITVKDLEVRYEAIKAEEILNDYTFKMLLPCGKSGTGWILDYEIPKERGQYPTTWYIATNAHVANQFKFAKSNYEQALPREVRDSSNDWRMPNLLLNSGDACKLSEKAGYFDFNLTKEFGGQNLRSNYGGIIDNQIYEPKLFYAPVNFLEKESSIPDNNYTDFAVIEVKFKTPGIAKDATNNFYGKYEEQKLRDPLNVFASPWDKQKHKKDIRLYSLGYEKDKESGYTFSYDGRQTSKLARQSSRSDSEGLISSSSIDQESLKTNWAGKKLNRVGDSYLIDNFAMKERSSGGLVIDADGNVWGMKSVDDTSRDQSYVTPLRSNDSSKTEKYDLILGGGPKQLSSYRRQVEKYILKDFRRTWLSDRGGWY